MAKVKIKERPNWWIISTHVLTVGIAMPFVASIVATVLLGVTHIEFGTLIAFLVMLMFQTLGYVGGIYYSLNYLRKTAISDSWAECITPSIITFSALSVLFFLGNALIVRDVIAVACFFVLYVVITIAFAKITANHFRVWDSRPETQLA